MSTTTSFPTPCQDMLDLLPEFVADALSSEQNALVLQHTAECHACAGELKKQRALVTAMVAHFKNVRAVGKRPQLPPVAVPASPLNRAPELGRAPASDHATSVAAPVTWVPIHFRKLLFGGGLVFAGALLFALIIGNGRLQHLSPTPQPSDTTIVTQLEPEQQGITIQHGELLEEDSARTLAANDQINLQSTYLVRKKATVTFPNKSAATLAANTKFRAHADGLLIDTGCGHFKIRPGKAFRVTVPTAVLAVRGTEFNVAATADKMLVVLYSGAVDVENEAGKVSIEQNGTVFTAAGEAPVRISDAMAASLPVPQRHSFLDQRIDWPALETAITAETTKTRQSAAIDANTSISAVKVDADEVSSADVDAIVAVDHHEVQQKTELPDAGEPQPQCGSESPEVQSGLPADPTDPADLHPSSGYAADGFGF